MTLKIFVSSVFGEFQAARRAIEEQVHRLQELFVGMEYYGADTAAPADLDAKKAGEADVYVALVGSNYGSEEHASKKSFTELEYEAAQQASVPLSSTLRICRPPRYHADAARPPTGSLQSSPQGATRCSGISRPGRSKGQVSSRFHKVAAGAAL